ncbi:MAG: FMN-binding protein [Lentisphaerae bacterium]|jgi:Na+-transporting NADH:ubiquinone oxidoreductase subunit NqrC|nr:FMN-binding protein [Lentisphaerota bacterium]MBT4818480.1 FMN-binding protein [Lentisphaerota bacterium]MBT5607808.1 FMN-binding protein [Lentisphaerota bacterium]MBT7058722.1 FMN-binding protein [Lentisphaerota bacterium]MBT7847082.1 FMN-binding protein [Lentisphaerota bacterium]
MNRDSRGYAIVFTVALCAACAALLTFANTHWQKLIAANEDFARIHAIVDALGLSGPEAKRADIVGTYKKNVELKPRGEMEVYEAREGKKLLGYAIELLGRGKYGPIKGVLAIGPHSRTIKALRIYEQQETPGLGGRIATMEWLSQFSGKPLVTSGVPGLIISSKVKGPNVVDAITGASKTTYSFGKMMNTMIARFLAGGMKLEALDFKLGPDAVTRATPGYPKNLKKPPHLRKEVRRPAFMVPPGTRNLAIDKPVTTSMEEEPIIGELEQIVDNVKKSGEFDFVEMDPGLQWVQIDLESIQTVHGIVVWHYYKNPTIYNDVIVQVADDVEFTQNVRTLFNNDHDDSAGMGAGKDTAFFARWWGELVDSRGESKEGTPVRCVRVFTDGGAGGADTRFVEIAVYGQAEGTKTNKTATASSK